MTPDEYAYLLLFSPDTYGLEIPRVLARTMERKGWIEWMPQWMPPKFATTLWAITDAGKAALIEEMRRRA